MLLLIDAGNSNIKWATMSSGQSTMQFGGVFSLTQSADSIMSDFNKNWGSLNPENIQISHVGSDLFPTLFQTWAQARWNIEPVYLKTEAQRAGVVNGYTNPAQLGVDRWLTLLAAHSFYKQTNKALCIIDSGTCVKIDILTAEGEHLGGCILPGEKMMVQSVEELLTRNGKVSQKTNRGNFESSSLKRYQLTQKDTFSGLASGVRFSQIAVIEKLCRDLPLVLEQKACQIILTGGGGHDLAILEPYDVVYRPHLVLQGIVAFNISVRSGQKYVNKSLISAV